MLNAKPGVGYKVVLVNETPTGHVLTRGLGSFRVLWSLGFFLTLTSRPSAGSNDLFQPVATAVSIRHTGANDRKERQRSKN